MIRHRRQRRWLRPSDDSSGAARRIAHPAARADGGRRQRGVALVMAITAVGLLAVVVADMQEDTSTAWAISMNQRDRVKAEYMAKSGLNLTRLLVAKEPEIRQAIAPLYQAFLGRPPPMLPVWRFSDLLLKPFCNYEESRGMQTGFDFGNAVGLGETDAMCEVNAYAENSKINVNMPLTLGGEQAKRSMAMNLFAMMGGYQSPSPFDPIFNELDPDGQLTSRLDVLSALIDWWDFDTDRTNFDPGRSEISASGSEEDLYRRLDDPYEPKNAPFDSLEELRLVRGVSDDFWATFIEPRPNAPEDRTITIYGSGLVNVNESPPEVLLARLCSFIESQPLCSNPVEAAKFVQLLNTARAMIPVPFFSRVSDFLSFVEGRGGPNDIYPMLTAFLGPENPLLFTPVSVPAAQRVEVDRSFVTAARIIAIESTGRAGRIRVGTEEADDFDCDDREDWRSEPACYRWRAQTRIRTIANFHNRWTPPPPNAGQMPGLGIYHYYRIE